MTGYRNIAKAFRSRGMARKASVTRGFLCVLLCAVAILLAGCASISTPQGGPRDETPPKMVKAFPAPGSTNVSDNQIAIDFDEFITLKDAFTNVVVSPTSDQQPRVSGVGRRVNVQFLDSLRPNTTYTIDFGDAIQDNNEGNALQGFSYTFSTGPEIDTLRISGMVLDSHTLEPQQGMIVGVHTSAADTAFSRMRLDRVARTDDRGRFVLRGLAPGKYRLFALKDLNGDMRWDNPEELLAFHDEWIIPTAQPTTVPDTIYYNVLTLQPDTVIEKPSAIYLPNDILLSSFSLGYRPQYLKSYQRPDSTRLVLVWNARQDSLPPIRLLDNPGRKLSDWAIPEIREGNDSVTLWLKDPAMLASDTIRLDVEYMRNITRDSIQFVNDSLLITFKRPKPKALKKGQEPVVPLLEVKGSGQSQEFPQPFEVTFGAPLRRLNPELVKMEQKIDTLWVPSSRPMSLVPGDSLNPRIYHLKGPWDFGTQYRLTLDSLAAEDIFGHSNKRQEFEFKVRAADEYSALTFTLSGLGGSPAFVELLDGSDRIVRTEPVKGGSVTFRYLLPATYYARVVFDLNGNGLYDTGDYDKRIQPEAVAYYPKKITLRKNWDQNINWDVNAVAVDMQKPLAVKKNRPKTPRGSNNNEEQTEEEEDEIFDPSANPFDPNQRRNRNRNRNGNGQFR